MRDGEVWLFVVGALAAGLAAIVFSWLVMGLGERAL